MKILVINGPNINLLGLREPDLYGKKSYADLLEFVSQACGEVNIDAEFFQSNSEGAIVDAIQGAYGRIDGIVINPAAYTHTSIAIPDALKAIAIPTVEVHLTDIKGREEYRRISYTSEACKITIVGKGFDGYLEAVLFLKDYLRKNQA
ncbi:MAG: type II 3-dehydroquinate dehydratase [Oscillospiraceae bacterium]